ncbi:hypothetical protein Nepgr_032780 [Nepenthes gracilis]|uniref:Protein XRI1 n=1 Tax=Nepenthes gracilis TaxID=150966 RepID=A0AAD3TK39_NEPGR|nr:hypothetical protein Nepgr_032780 [Nepenthes gracilis]
MNYSDGKNCISESWELEGEEDYHVEEKASNLEISECLWDGVTQNEDDISYMFEETTPIKACGEFPYLVNDCENVKMVPEECNVTYSQGKRRRMLQFNNESMDSSEGLPSSFLKSKERIVSLEDVLPEVSQWETGFHEGMHASGFEDVDQSESWLVDCLNGYDIHVSSDLNPSGASAGKIDVAEIGSVETGPTDHMVEQRAVRTCQNIVFKGRKSYMRTHTKMASSVAYPFTFIKPCGAHGDVTLKDINRRIHTPPLKPNQQKDDPSASFPTSAFSGKPVVGKTKIRTEGGKGSITIMRTKG